MCIRDRNVCYIVFLHNYLIVAIQPPEFTVQPTSSTEEAKGDHRRLVRENPLKLQLVHCVFLTHPKAINDVIDSLPLMKKWISVFSYRKHCAILGNDFHLHLNVLLSFFLTYLYNGGKMVHIWSLISQR